MFWFQALRYRRFQLGFDGVNLHSLTLTSAAVSAVPDGSTTRVYQRKLNLKAWFESGSSYYSIKR